MLGSFRKSKTNIFAWALLALLVVGLIGLYGTRSGGLVARDIAAVGNEGIGAQEFYSALNRQIGELSRQTGQNLSMSQARVFGIDRSVLAALIGTAALDSETGALGISAGDETVKEQLLITPAFQGVDGGFDRDAYDFALENANLSASEYDDTLRQSIARDLLRAGLVDGLNVPDAATHAILGYLGEERSFDWLKLDRLSLGTAMPVPSDTDLREYFTDNADLFMLPAARDITYVSLSPDMLIERFEATEEALREEYAARANIYSTPERRSLDRIVFGTTGEGATAWSTIDNGGKTFDDVAADRGLSSTDIDIGEVAASSLDADARALVFGADGPGVVGPVSTSLGPALFRINAIIAAKSTPFEDVREELDRALALPEALDLIAQVASDVEDLLAGGATLEDIAGETDLVLAKILLSQGMTEGLGADPVFQQEAFVAELDEERDVFGLSDGGVAVLRVNEIIAAHPPEFTDAEADVRIDWEATRAGQLLVERAEAIKTRIEAGESLATIAEETFQKLNIQTNVARGAQIGGVPRGMVAAVFDLTDGGIVVVPLTDGATVVRLAGIKKLDTGAPDQETSIAAVLRRQTAETQSDIFSYFAQAVQDREGVVVNQALLEQVLSQIP